MINAQEVAASLTAGQRRRLLALFAERKAQPWEEGDDELKGRRLVHCFRQERGGDRTELNNSGWSVAMLLDPPAA